MSENYYGDLVPGVFVINKDKKYEWGIGQIQSAINDTLTINFPPIEIILVKIYKLVSRKVSNRLEVPITASFTALTRKNASMLARFTYPNYITIRLL